MGSIFLRYFINEIERLDMAAVFQHYPESIQAEISNQSNQYQSIFFDMLSGILQLKNQLVVSGG